MTSWKSLMTKLKTEPTVSIPDAGKAFGLSENAAYRAVKNNRLLGLPVLEVGGVESARKRIPSIAILRKLGLVEEGSN
jgi:hypothetical protein